MIEDMAYSLLIFTLIVVTSSVVAGQQADECNVEKGRGGKYEKVYASTGVAEGRRVLLVAIKLEPAKFNDDHLRQVARRIREVYCNEKIISVQIWDRSDRRRFDDLTPPPLYAPFTRATYYLDRTTRTEKLNYYKDEKVGREIELN